jgi:hypothetical protein
VASELRAKDFAAAGFDDLEFIEDPRLWSWMFERSLIVPFVSAVMASVIVLMLLTGAMSFQRDPLNALANRNVGTAGPLDTSWSVEFRVVPGNPVGFELRKVGSDETLHFYQPGN